eukprot:Gb_10538 [translate_table: standard]
MTHGTLFSDSTYCTLFHPSLLTNTPTSLPRRLQIWSHLEKPNASSVHRLPRQCGDRWQRACNRFCRWISPTTTSWFHCQ